MPMWPSLFLSDTGWPHPCFKLRIILACTVVQEVTFEELALVTAMSRSTLRITQSGLLVKFCTHVLALFTRADITTDTSLNQEG